MKITAVLCVRNEGAFLLEWLAHHRACGITDFLVFTNDCEDGTDRMLDRLQDLGWLSHVPNPGPHPEGPQWAALKQADKHPLVRSADWLLPLDIDEFVNVHVGDRTIPALLAALPQATAIALTWRMFGNAGFTRYEDVPITETFTRAAPVPLYWPWRASLFKTLYRNDGTYRKLGVHRPRNPDPERLPQQRWFDGSGRALPVQFHTQRLFLDPGTNASQLVQLNHYALGAAESFVLKCARGRAVHSDDRMGMDYWIDRNFNEIEDRSILALQSSGLRDALHADATLQHLHAAAVVWRNERFKSLMREEPWRALYGRLLMAPPSRVLDRAVLRRLLER
ncbi:MAG: glycosyltransferase family 2 protein [Tabrizicola sp.]|nr:glycosyltransferase family 2 protein [Tabrizicola sp.]